MLLSKLLQFIVLLASLIASISVNVTAGQENVYTVTPTTILSPNLQYINTSQLRQKTPTRGASTSSSERTGHAVAEDHVASGSSINSYERKTVREDKGESPKFDESKEAALKQLLDRRLIKR